uniref:Uncharacterized protein n=1 Tax=Mycena chlorophos TaxID=658473 RepID=A0ABQ0MCK0_MYCCL|nr:predicted protein [Mycena chlorophos]
MPSPGRAQAFSFSPNYDRDERRDAVPPSPRHPHNHARAPARLVSRPRSRPNQHPSTCRRCNRSMPPCRRHLSLGRRSTFPRPRIPARCTCTTTTLTSPSGYAPDSSPATAQSAPLLQPSPPPSSSTFLTPVGQARPLRELIKLSATRSTRRIPCYVGHLGSFAGFRSCSTYATVLSVLASASWSIRGENGQAGTNWCPCLLARIVAGSFWIVAERARAEPVNSLLIALSTALSVAYLCLWREKRALAAQVKAIWGACDVLDDGDTDGDGEAPSLVENARAHDADEGDGAASQVPGGHDEVQLVLPLQAGAVFNHAVPATMENRQLRDCTMPWEPPAIPPLQLESVVQATSAWYWHPAEEVLRLRMWPIVFETSCGTAEEVVAEVWSTVLEGDLGDEEPPICKGKGKAKAEPQDDADADEEPASNYRRQMGTSMDDGRPVDESFEGEAQAKRESVQPRESINGLWQNGAGPSRIPLEAMPEAKDIGSWRFVSAPRRQPPASLSANDALGGLDVDAAARDVTTIVEPGSPPNTVVSQIDSIDSSAISSSAHIADRTVAFANGIVGGASAAELVSRITVENAEADSDAAGKVGLGSPDDSAAVVPVLEMDDEEHHANETSLPKIDARGDKENRSSQRELAKPPSTPSRIIVAPASPARPLTSIENILGSTIESPGRQRTLVAATSPNDEHETSGAWLAGKAILGRSPAKGRARTGWEA